MGDVRRTRPRKASIAVYFTGDVAAVAMMMAFTPAALAATPHSTLIARPPYAGTAQIDFDWWSKSGCGAAKVVKPAIWNATSGKGVISERTSAVSCVGYPVRSAGPPSSGYASGEFDLGIPVPITKTGYGHVAVHWKVHAIASASLVMGTCNPGVGTYWDCVREAFAIVASVAYLRDLTNGSTRYSSTSWTGLLSDTYNDTSCFNGSCVNLNYSLTAAPSSANVSWFFSGSFNSGHHYAVLAYFFVASSSYVRADNTTLSGGAAYSVADMGTPGNFAKLTSIQVS